MRPKMRVMSNHTPKAVNAPDIARGIIWIRSAQPSSIATWAFSEVNNRVITANITVDIAIRPRRKTRPVVSGLCLKFVFNLEINPRRNGDFYRVIKNIAESSEIFISES